VYQPRPALPGAYPDRTVLANFHSASDKRHTTVAEFRAVCRISVGDRYLFTINDSPDPNLVFPASIRNPVQAKRTPTGALENIYKIEEVWAIVEDLDQPLLIDLASFTDRTAKCTTRFLSGSIGTSYENNTAIYNVTFKRVAITPMFNGTWAGAPSKYANGKYTVAVKTKFPTSATVPYPTAVYLKMMKQTEQGRWVDYVPAVQGSTSPLKTGVAERRKNPLTKQIMEGDVAFSSVTTDGNVEYIVEDLPAGTKFACFISDVSSAADLISLVRDGDTTSDYYLMQVQKIPQPMLMCTFQTPPAEDSDENIRIMAYSCIDGNMSAFKSFNEQVGEYHFKVGTGDNSYQDSCEDERDYELHYDGLHRNEHYHRMLVNGGNVMLADDHEVTNDWDSAIVLHQGNAAQFQLTGPEAALYNAIMGSSLYRAYVPFTRLANDGLKTSVVDNAKIYDAYAAFDKSLPTMPPHKDHVSRNWSDRWGSVLALFVNSKPYLHHDGTIEYWKRRACVSQSPGGPQQITWVDASSGEKLNQFIPAPGLQFIKDELLADKQLPGHREASAKFIFFSGNVAPVYTPQQRAAFLEKFIQISASAVEDFPSSIAPLATSLFDKLWVQRRYDKTDLASSPDIVELVQWMKVNKIKNVFFVTGDPHNSTVQYLDRENVIVEACFSTLGNYRSSSITATFMGKPDNDRALFNVVENSWGDIDIDSRNRVATIRVLGEHGLLAAAKVPLAR
jgi:hypothetical protein